MFELQTYPKHVCMYVCLTAPSKYVCMYVWGSWTCVCVSHSKLQNQLLSEGVKFLIKTLQNLTFNSFFLNCEGGYFREPSWAPNVYVCMSELQTYPKHICMYVRLTGPSKYVCMSEAPAEHVCMYVSANWACMYVCLRHTEHVCMYVSNIHR